jgi:hypothetical protein
MNKGFDYTKTHFFNFKGLKSSEDRKEKVENFKISTDRYVKTRTRIVTIKHDGR